MDIKVSVIMPIYNAEKYLDKSINSILNQSLKEFELILVNDGSSDKSIRICEKYKLKDERIIVINKKNEGACIARNTGIEISKGEFIQFIDADDYVDTKMLEEQYNLAKKNNSQVTMCGMKYDIWTKKGNVIFEESVYKNMILDNQDDIKVIFMELFKDLLFNYTHNKLYNTKFLKDNNLKFINWLPIDQDTNFNIDVFKVLQRLSISTKSYYHYVKTFDETIVNSYHVDKFKVRTFRYERLKTLLIEWNIYNDKNKIKIGNMYILQVIDCFDSYNHSKCNLTYNEKIKDIKNIVELQQIRENIDRCNVTSIYTFLVIICMKIKAVNTIYMLTKFKHFIKKNFN